MNVKGWLAGLGAVVLIDAFIALVLWRMAMEENCDNGIPRWQCSDSLEDLLGGALIGVPLLYVLLLVVVTMRTWVERRESGTPS